MIKISRNSYNSNFLNLLRVSIYGCCILVILSCSNLFKSFSNKNTDEAYYEEALKATDNLLYDTALSNYALISSAFMGQTYVKRTYAGALAGKCGLNFIEYTQRLQNASIGGGTSFFLWLMKAFTQKIVSPSHCTLAEAQMMSIPTAEKTAGDSFNLAILSMVKLGAYMRNKADVDSTDSLGDGSSDVDFDPCLNTVGGAHNLDDTEMKEVVTGFSNMLLNLTSIATIAGGVSDSLSAMNVFCQAISPNPCSKTDSSSVTDSDINFFRDLLATSPTHPSFPMGIGSCTTDPNWRACCAPDP